MTQKTDKTVTERAADKARDTVDDAADAASGKVKAEAKAARDRVAAEAEKTADAADAAAAEFDNGSIQAKAIEEVASRIDDVATQIRSTDIDRAARMVGDAARRNPMLFVAGAALAGFAATRFLKARDPAHRAAEGLDPWDRRRDGGTAWHIGSARHDVPSQGL